MEPGRPVGGTYYLYRTLRRLDLSALERALVEMLMGDGELTAFEQRLVEEDVAERLERLKTDIEEEIRRRLVADRGRSEEHTSELQSRPHLVCRLLLEKKKQYHA